MAPFARKPSAASVLERLHAAATPGTAQFQAPVLLVERVLDPALCTQLMEHWKRGEKQVDGVASAAGAALASADIKRRRDVPVDDAALFSALREALVRRVLPAILQAFHIRIVQFELPV